MAVPIAAQGAVGIRRESSFASGGAIDNYQPVISEDLVLNQLNVHTDRIQSAEGQIGSTPHHKTVTGPVVFGVSPSNPQQWWACGIGSSNNVSPYNGYRPLPTMLIASDRKTAAIQTSGDLISTMSFSSSQDGELQCSVAIEGQDMASRATFASTALSNYTSGDAPYVHSEAVFTLNGTVNKDVMSFNVEINNNPATDLFGSDKVRRDIPAKKRTVTGSFTKLFQDTVERNAFLANQNRSFQVVFSRGAKSFDINIGKIHYDSHTEPLAGQNDYIVESFPWTAFYDDPNTEKDIILTIT